MPTVHHVGAAYSLGYDVEPYTSMVTRRWFLEEAAAGDWLLMAWKDLGHSAKRYRLQKGETRKYPDVPTSVGYSMVTYWRLRVTVRAKEASEITLTDRNVWITALKEERRYPDQPAPTGPKRR